MFINNGADVPETYCYMLLRTEDVLWQENAQSILNETRDLTLHEIIYICYFLILGN